MPYFTPYTFIGDDTNSNTGNEVYSWRYRNADLSTAVNIITGGDPTVSENTKVVRESAENW